MPLFGSGQQTATTATPIAKGFGTVVLLALLALIVLRHLFGSIRIEAGAH